MNGTNIRDIPDGKSASGSDTLTVLSNLVGRLEAIVQAETDALRRNRPFDLNDTNRQKQQGLLELRRLMPRLSSIPNPDIVRGRLQRLTGSLEQNRKAIDIQLRAVREVADIIAHTMKEAESDGTYSRGFGAF